MKNILIGTLAIAVLLGGAVWLTKSTESRDTNVISRNGLHWHPILEIYVKGEKQALPSNIGVGGVFDSQPMGMAPVHTHDDAIDGVVHLEFGGVVSKNDTTLDKFFESWGKDINSLGLNVVMSVNGVENTELGDYQMKDSDRIVLRYQ